MLSVDDYWVLLECGEDDSARIGKLPDDCPEDWELLEGEPIAHEFPKEVILRFSRRHPKMVKLYDFVENTLLLRIVSDKVKRVFEEMDIERIEYIPVIIHDHQGSEVANNYYVLNVMNTQPIIDMKKSKYVVDCMDDSKLESIKKMHLDVATIDPQAKLFRATQYDTLYFITNDVLKALNKAGITGIRVKKAEGWDGQTLEL